MRSILVAWFVAALFGATHAMGVVIPSDPQYVRSLDGQWRFKLEQSQAPGDKTYHSKGQPPAPDYPKTFEPFYESDFKEGGEWKDIAVPGNWEIPGYSPATYNQPDNSSAFYRDTFEVPKEWEGRLVLVNFDGVQNGCEIWCNGQPVKVDRPSGEKPNYHESGWTAWQVDLTPAIKFGQKNLLALRVTKNTPSVDADTGDFFFLGGVYRTVTLFSVPQSHLRDFTVRTKLLDDDKAQVQVILDGADVTDKISVIVQLEGQPETSAKFTGHDPLNITQTVEHPKLWSAETPNLYSLTITLKDADGKPLETIKKRIGIREISTKDGVFTINRKPVKLIGICRHDVYPTLGSAVNEEVWKKDLALMKAANFNAVRTSHYPDGSGFYDLCDEMGFYVLDEEPFCWIKCDQKQQLPLFDQRVRETIARDKNHPCVVIWGVGNENALGVNNIAAANLTEEIDPTRLRLISCRQAGEGGAHTDFDDKHYVTPKRIAAAEADPRRKTWPQIYTENPNVWDVRNGPDYGSLDLWAAVIVRTWREIYKDDHVCGSFLWEWTDRAVADKNPTKWFYWYPQTGINLLKVKGVVDGFRNPRPEYFHIKMAQAPIVVESKADVSEAGVRLRATNHYSFTDLRELETAWHLLQGAKELASGKAELALAPHTDGSVDLPLPAEHLASADALRVEFNHPGVNGGEGWNVATYQVPLKPSASAPPAPPKLARIDSLTFPRFHLLAGKRVRDQYGWWKLDGANGQLTHVSVTDADGQTTSASDPASMSLGKVHAIDGDIAVNGAVVGHLHAQLAGAQLSYQVKWTGDKTEIYELGWQFSLPKGIDHFSWSRQARWSYYPPDHIGRPTGTATPDSADQQLTHLTRGDAFDFNSTKFNCDWAGMSDGKGKGLCLVFDEKQRQHARGGIDAQQGNPLLIVDRCYSPPQDISSSLVPDLYTSLEKGDTIEGSFTINSANSAEGK